MILKNEIVINDSYEFITCRECGKQSKRLYGGHLKSHGMTSEDYLKKFPNAPLMAKKDTEKMGKHMKEEKYKKMFSEKFSGENNPNHVSKTTEEERRSRSPFSKDFIKYKDDKTDEQRKFFVQEALKDRVLTTSIRYYLDKGYNEEVAEKMLSKRQRTFSEKICIEKYGEDEGKKLFTNRQNKWQKSLLENGNLKGGYSLISQKLFNIIITYYNESEICNLYYATNKFNSKGEFRINRSTSGIWIYDFVDLKNKKIIEYNGDQYHANPKIYKANDISHNFNIKRGLTAELIWDKDRRKTEDAIKEGFEVLTIWDSEYKKNKEETLNKCLNFLGIEKTTI